MDFFGTEAKARVASLEQENAVYRETNLSLNTELTQEKQAVARLTKSYQDEVAANTKLKLELVQVKADLVDAEMARDHYDELSEERYGCLAAIVDENKDLTYKVSVLEDIQRQTNFVINVKPRKDVRKADKK